jgi:hypothetical protein
MELKQELYNIGLAFVWRKQHECHLTEMTKTVRDRRNDTGRYNILAKLSEKTLKTLHREINFCSVKDHVQDAVPWKERGGTAWLLASVWKLREKGRRRLCLGEEDVTHINGKGKGKAVPLQAWTGPQGSRRSRLPDF